MNTPTEANRVVVLALLALAWPATVRGQTTILASDFFTTPGQYYEAYVEKDVSVAGLVGVPGSDAQAWDFTTGDTNNVYRYDYVDLQETPDAASFPDARFAERLTDKSSDVVKWLYLKQVPGQGRLTFGFNDSEFSSGQPVSVFTPPIRDFPEVIGFGDTWATSTEFLSEISFGIPDDGEDGGGDFSVPTRVTYSSTAKVDAYGIINQPKLGFADCLRVNELVQYDIAVDFGDGYQDVATQYVRNYYWLRKGRGIAVQVTSRQEDAPPSNDFSVAAVVTRMYVTNHEAGSDGSPSIGGLKMTLGKDGALLQWNKAAGIKSYRVEYLANGSLDWQPLVESTASNFAVDGNANKPESPARLYRVVGFKQ